MTTHPLIRRCLYASGAALMLALLAAGPLTQAVYAQEQTQGDVPTMGAGDVGLVQAIGAGKALRPHRGYIPLRCSAFAACRWGMLVRLFGKLLVNPINIPLRCSAFATRRCPPSKAMSST